MMIDIEQIQGIKVIQFWNPERKKTQYCLLENYSFWYECKEYTVEAGFVTDWASVPQWLWSFFHPTGEHDSADLEHDFLYDNKISTREEVDFYFYQRMIECGLSRLNAGCRYLGVRLGGKKWWDK
jgi:hypothetical protein